MISKKQNKYAQINTRLENKNNLFCLSNKNEKTIKIKHGIEIYIGKKRLVITIKIFFSFNEKELNLFNKFFIISPVINKKS